MCLLTILSFPTFGQEKAPKKSIFKRLFSSEKTGNRQGALMIFPALSTSPEKGIEYGAFSNYTFYTHPQDSLIRSSFIGAIGTLTTKGQSNAKFYSSLWTAGNRYHIFTEISPKNYPFQFYGIGDQTLEKDKTYLIQKSLRVNLEAEKRIVKDYYAGLNLRYETFSFKYRKKAENGPLDLNDFYAGQGGKYLALGVTQIFDNRNSITETTKGEYIKVKYSYAPNFWGGENFSGSFVFVDAKKFFPLKPTLTLGLQGNYQGVFGKNTPYYLLPQLGNDEIMRGYYPGRFRNKNILVFQTELRYRIHPRIGLAGFTSAGNAFESQLNLQKTKLAYGAGARYFFNLEHNTSIRFDFALGQKMQNEKRPSGFYISLGQAF